METFEESILQNQQRNLQGDSRVMAPYLLAPLALRDLVPFPTEIFPLPPIKSEDLFKRQTSSSDAL